MKKDYNVKVSKLNDNDKIDYVFGKLGDKFFEEINFIKEGAYAEMSFIIDETVDMPMSQKFIEELTRLQEEVDFHYNLQTNYAYGEEIVYIELHNL